MSTVRFLEGFAAHCKKTPGLLGLFLTHAAGEELLLTAVCTERGLADLARVLPGCAAASGPLVGHLEEEGRQTLLFAQPPHLVTVALLAGRDFYGLGPQDQVVWEWNRGLTNTRRPRAEQELPELLQWVEERFWVTLYRAALCARQDRRLEAADLCALLRNRMLLPLLSLHNRRHAGAPEHRAGAYAEQLQRTHPALDRERLLDALEAARQIYFALRYELATERFVRCEEAELLATALLEAP
ncbi:MAG: hypothetical protein GXX99_06230 [Clostridiales bacterium]|nr:hypothetical protein [Clostridiales bacterium]